MLFFLRCKCERNGLQILICRVWKKFSCAPGFYRSIIYVVILMSIVPWTLGT